MPPTAEHVVAEQRDDDERVGDARSVGSKPVRQREEHVVDEKNVVPLKAKGPTNCKCPHKHHNEYDDDDLPNLCQHYRGRATVTLWIYPP